MRKEFFGINLDEIRKAFEGLERGKDFLGTVTWTEKARAQQYYDTLDIDGDPAAREKWLTRSKLVVERRQREVRRTSAFDAGQNGDEFPEPLAVGEEAGDRAGIADLERHDGVAV